METFVTFTYLGSTLYLLNQIEQTSAASSVRPSSDVDEGVGSSAQLESVVADGVGNRGKSKPACRFD